MKHLLHVVAAIAACMATFSGPAIANSAVYPSQAIHLIVPTTAGGSYDVLARQLAGKLSAELGQAVVVENRTGAGTVVGTQTAAQAPADGYTLMIGGLSNIVLNHGLYEKLPYKVGDFTPIALVGATSYTLVVRPDLPLHTVQQVVDYARANPGKLNIASAGIGTGQHVAAALLKATANIDLTLIPYKGAQPVYTDLFGGRVDLFFDSTATAKPFMDSGKVRAIVTSAAHRDPLAPQVPTGKEGGLDGLVMEGWLGVFAPAKTPPAVVDKLRAALANVMRDVELRKRLEVYGMRLIWMTPTDTEKFIESEMKKWPPFLRRAGIKAD